MKTTIDRAGRVVIPAVYRAELGLEAGQDLEVRVVDGRLEIEPVDAPVRMVEEDGILVFDADGAVEQTTDEQVRAAIEADREERARQWL